MGFIFLVTIAGTAAYIVLTAPLSIKLRLGADQVNSKPHEMASAIAHVVSRNHPDIRISVISTGGSSENMTLLAKANSNWPWSRQMSSAATMSRYWLYSIQTCSSLWCARTPALKLSRTWREAKLPCHR
jgi:spore coat protein U-like protein